MARTLLVAVTFGLAAVLAVSAQTSRHVILVTIDGFANFHL